MSERFFRGSIVALITPFTETDAVDLPQLEALVDWQIDQGTAGIVPCGTTGESPTLTHDEHHQVVELVVRKAAGRVPIIAGTGSNATHEAIALTHYAANAGADAALIVAPYYNKPSQEGLFQHFKTIADAVPNFPIIIYNIPGRSIVDISNDTMARLARETNIIGVKDATSDLTRIGAYRDLCGADFCQLSGEDATTLGYMVMGGHGCISVSANVAPKLCADFQTACREGDWSQAQALNQILMPLHQALFMAPSPAPVKYVASLLGLCRPNVRLPLVELDLKEKKVLEQIADRIELKGR